MLTGRMLHRADRITERIVGEIVGLDVWVCRYLGAGQYGDTQSDD
jgi:hypothetical protein